MKRFFLLTQPEKVGTIDGMNLFFGALLGANLGTLNSMRLGDYIAFVCVLAGTVMALRMISTSERRSFAISFVVFYGLVLVAMWNVPALQPKGLAVGDLHRTLATLAIWVGAVVIQELSPALEPSDIARRGK